MKTASRQMIAIDVVNGNRNEILYIKDRTYLEMKKPEYLVQDVKHQIAGITQAWSNYGWNRSYNGNTVGGSTFCSTKTHVMIEATGNPVHSQKGNRDKQKKKVGYRLKSHFGMNKEYEYVTQVETETFLSWHTVIFQKYVGEQILPIMPEIRGSWQGYLTGTVSLLLLWNQNKKMLS